MPAQATSSIDATRLMAELQSIRQQASAVVARIDRLLVEQPPVASADEFQALHLRYRLRPGGALSPDGEAEMFRRFAEGQTNPVIARDLGVSVQGVAKRRRQYNLGAAARRPGALRGRIHMAPDFDELPNEDIDAMEGRFE